MTFHFNLVHVPGTSHGPDGLSPRPRQPNDDPEEPDDFEDWIDQLYGLMHQINDPYAPRRSAIIPLPFACVFAGAQNKNLEEESADSDSDNSAPTVEDQYSLIPRKDNISTKEERINEV